MAGQLPITLHYSLQNDLNMKAFSGTKLGALHFTGNIPAFLQVINVLLL